MSDQKLRSVNKTLANVDTIHPKETVEKAKNALKKMGQDCFISIENVSYIDNLDVPVYIVHSNNRRNEWGKGATDIQCQASALMERIERYSSIWYYRKNANHIRATFNKLKQPAISRSTFILTNVQRVLYGARRIDDVEMDWLPARSLQNKKEYLVPAQCIYLNHPQAADYPDSNGLAAGNTISEAISHAICEVIERHFLHLIYFNHPEAKKIDLSTTTNPHLIRLIKKLQEKGFEILAHDQSGDFLVPTISAFVYHPTEKKLFYSYFHLGTAPDPEIAMIRALTEHIQNRAINLYRDSQTTKNESFLESNHREKPLLQFLQTQNNCIPFDQITKIQANNFEEEVKILVEDTTRLGFDTLFYDMTHPDLKIPVVKVFIPGLQPNFLLHDFSWNDKFAMVGPNLSVFQKAMDQCKERKFEDQDIDEIIVLKNG